MKNRKILELLSWFKYWYKGIPYKGICGHCGKRVYHCYPWFTMNPGKEGAMPLHEECAKVHLFGAVGYIGGN